MNARFIVQFMLFVVIVLPLGQEGASAADFPGITVLVSAANDGSQGNGPSYSPSISANGRFVAFASDASNLVDGDTNDMWDIFVRNMQTGITERISVTSDGEQGNADSFQPSISGDGRYVAFTSYASNLVDGITLGYVDVFVHDRETGMTERVSIPGDWSLTSWAEFPFITADGRYVSFTAYMDTLVSIDANGYPDVFVYDRLIRKTEMASIAPDGLQFHIVASTGSDQTFVTPDGRFVVFTIWQEYGCQYPPGCSHTPEGVYVRDRLAGTTEKLMIARPSGGYYSHLRDGTMTADGRYVALIASEYGWTDEYVFVYDRMNGETELVNVTIDGFVGNDSWKPRITSDGRYVVFSSYASNLVSDDSNDQADIFVRDRLTHSTWLVSKASDGTQGNGWSGDPSISVNGSHVAFTSNATNLVTSDANDYSDIFVRDRRGAIFTVIGRLYFPLIVR